MSATSASAAAGEVVTCFFCGKEIAYGQWFARLRLDSRQVIFCRPQCLELFLQESQQSSTDWPGNED